jgi:hypothetical protein
MQAAGVSIKEFATNPQTKGADGVMRMLGSPVLAEQQVSIGASPTESAAFSQETHFIELAVGLKLDPNRGGQERHIHYELGLDPRAELVKNWKAGALPAPTIPLENGARIVLEVGPGSRIAFLGENLGVHDAPRSPTMARAAAAGASTDNPTVAGVKRLIAGKSPQEILAIHDELRREQREPHWVAYLDGMLTELNVAH